MGTPQFLMWMTIFCGVWLAWNSLAPEEMQFDPRSLNFTLLTLMLSLQASYAAPLLLSLIHISTLPISAAQYQAPGRKSKIYSAPPRPSYGQKR